MYVLFEDGGQFRAATVMGPAGEASTQVELPTGRRLKIKNAQILLRFSDPLPEALLEQAPQEAEALDLEFLWEVAGDEEFDFTALAQEYYGQPDAVQQAAMLLRLHSAPIYFHRKGKGRFRRAPEEILRAALAGLEKKRRRQEQIEHWRNELLAGRLPDGWQPLVPMLLYAPDRNRPEVQALETAASERQTTPVRLLLAVGAVADTHEYHFGRFAHELLPDEDTPPPLSEDNNRFLLPQAGTPAFSIDDHTTTEIDDAFSVERRANGGWRVGVHIAAPALSTAPDDALDAWARTRMSTIYMPGRKIPMLPAAAIERHTLAQGRWVPALSLYFDFDAALALRGHETRLEQVYIAANLRLNTLEPLFNETTLAQGLPEPFPYRDELKLLYDLACIFEAGRGRPSTQAGMVDYLFYVDWSIATADGPGYVTLVPRPRGAPIDKLVSELAIATNVRWGEMLKEAGFGGIYRAQPPGEKVRMSVHAEPHEGLGVSCYAWSTSPLRRYVDLVNQRQLVALVQGAPAPYDRDALAEVIPRFESLYAQYQEWQRQMERYWALRWLRQRGQDTIAAAVTKEQWVRLEGTPLAVKVPSLPPAEPGKSAIVALETVDLVDLEVKARFIGWKEATTATGG